MPPAPLQLFDPVLSTRAMRRADQHTIEELGMPARTLMELAGQRSADVIERHLGAASGRRVLVLCGKGNNGGDGLVVARVLHSRGATVEALITGDADSLTPDSRANLELLRAIASEADNLSIRITDSPERLNLFWPEIIVDALLGVGIGGELRAPVDALAKWVAQAPAKVVSLDIPTGINSDTGEAARDAVRASITVTMGAMKAGLVTGDGPDYAGTVEVVDIAIPRATLQREALSEGSGLLATEAAIKTLLPVRPRRAHKYSAGRVLIIAGSRSFPGAAVMTGLAAARAGAGAVTVAIPESARHIAETHLTEVMTVGLPETDDGTASLDALGVLRERAEEADSVIIGPGLGRHSQTQALVRRLLVHLRPPLVIDADGLNALAGHTDLIRGHAAGRWILTPHLGELRRLLDRPDLEPTEPFRVTREIATQLDAVLLKKGMPSVVAAPGGPAFLSPMTTPALATAGTGDILSGIIGGLVAQGLEPVDAAIVGLHLSGAAARRFAASAGVRSMVATDILEHLPATPNS